MEGVYRKKLIEDTYDTSEGALPFHLQRIAEEDLGETAARRKESLEKLAKLLSEEPDLNSRKDTEFLLRFLRVRKYNVEAALQTIRNYYNNRSSCDAVYREFLPSKVPPEARKLVMVMPEKDVHGRPIVFVNLGAWSAKQVPHAIFHRACMMCFDHITSEPTAQILGMVLLVDAHNLAVENALSVKPGIIKAGLQYVQDCMPSRMKAFHVVRQAHAFDIIYAAMKPFLKSKLASRFHGENFDSLHKEISPQYLPPDMGGQAPPFDHDGFWKGMDELENRFETDNLHGYSNKYLGDFATKEEIEKDLDFF